MRNENSGRHEIEILLAEDNAADAASALSAFKKANIVNPVRVFHTGNEVLDYLFRVTPVDAPAPAADSLLLLSLQLADAHGLDVLRKIKADERTKALQVLILASSHEERGVMQSYKLGAAACIVKPIDLLKITEALAELRLGWRLVSRGDATSHG